MKRLLSFLMAVLLFMSLPMTVLASNIFDLTQGDVNVNANESGQVTSQTGRDDYSGTDVVITTNGATTNNNITVNAEAGSTANVTLQDVKIDTSSSADNSHKGEAAMDISGAGNVVVELDGENSLTSGNWRAGLETSQDGGSLTIQDKNNDGSLTAQGGASGAGIGGGGGDLNNPKAGNGSDITISGGKITATGGTGAAGIGGGSNPPGYEGGGTGSNIAISGGKVNATGGSGGAAGIGGGNNGSGDDIAISGGVVTATGTRNGAGIGGGNKGSGSDIAISGGEVKATGGVNASGNGGGAGIGGGSGGSGENIAISGGEVTATGGNTGAGIGGGKESTGSNISISGGKVTATSSVNKSGEGSGAGIGGGSNSTGENISISGNAQVTATGSGTAADIGSGAQKNDTVKQDNDVNTDYLSTNGSITGSDGESVHGTYVPQPSAPSAAPVYVEETPAPRSSGTSTSGYSKGALWSKGYITRTLFKVENGAGMKPAWEEVLEDGALTITAENEPVVLTIWLEGMKELQKQGIETIVIRTANCETELVLAELIALNGTEYILTQEGETAVLVVDGNPVEI